MKVGHEISAPEGLFIHVPTITKAVQGLTASS